MRSALRGVPGVECAHANFQQPVATVVCKGDCDRSTLLGALQKEGYGAVIRE